MNHSVQTPTQRHTSAVRPHRPATGPRGHIGRIVAGSLATGLVAGVLLAFAPFIPASETGATGALLCGFALGWALLAVLSVRFTDQPQRWAAVPAAFMGLGGLLLIGFGSSAQHVLTWVWPPALLGVVIWMVVQTRRQVRSTAARVLLYPVFAILAVAAVGGGVETVLEAYDAHHYPMAGQLVDVDGHGMHLSCTGTGSPTVVLEPGAGDMASTMAWIAPAVARDTRVCVYDRPGRGWSHESDAPQDGTRVAADLHTLLHAAHVPGPYVLAGHSFGGLYVLAYAAHYPADVAGMVLIDSTAPTTAAPGAVAPAVRNDVLVRASALASIVSRVGLGRLYALISYGTLPSPAREEVRASISTPATLHVDDRRVRRRGTPRCRRRPSCALSATRRCSSSPRAAAAPRAGSRTRTSWPGCRPTRRTASSTEPPTRCSSRTRPRPRRRPRPSARSSRRSGPGHRSPSRPAPSSRARYALTAYRARRRPGQPRRRPSAPSPAPRCGREPGDSTGATRRVPRHSVVPAPRGAPTPRRRAT